MHLSVYDMILNAGAFVQAIALLLITLSVTSWAIFFYTYHTLKSLQKELRRISMLAHSTDNIEKLYTCTLQTHPCNLVVFKKLFDLWQHFHTKPQYILDSVLLHADSARDQAGHMTSWLASISSAAPFIGLLGTVWGIIDSFQAIARTQETHLSVVAPGIAEALALTALGLMVAIPATVLYNILSNQMNGYTNQISNTVVQCINTLRNQVKI